MLFLLIDHRGFCQNADERCLLDMSLNCDSSNTSFRGSHRALAAARRSSDSRIRRRACSAKSSSVDDTIRIPSCESGPTRAASMRVGRAKGMRMMPTPLDSPLLRAIKRSKSERNSNGDTATRTASRSSPKMRFLARTSERRSPSDRASCCSLGERIETTRSGRETTSSDCRIVSSLQMLHAITN
ncbi:hypothetical protein ABH945_006996 [Paraburkholderia sp. GAS333]